MKLTIIHNDRKYNKNVSEMEKLMITILEIMNIFIANRNKSHKYKNIAEILMIQK